MGQLIAMSVVQGGCGFPFLSEAVFQYICHGSADGIQMDPNDLADGVLRTVIYKVEKMSCGTCTVYVTCKVILCRSTMLRVIQM